MKKVLLIVFVLFVFLACQRISIVNYENYDKIPNTRNLNTCKTLTDTVQTYMIFVDADIYHPWTEFEINATIDSVEKATKWIENQAFQFGHQIKIQNNQHKQGSRLTINENSAKTSLSANGMQESMKRKAMKKLLPWADAISKYASKGLKYRPSKKVHMRLKIEDMESFQLALRDHLGSADVAVMFFVNGFFEEHQSFSYHTQSVDYNTEYSIITTKNPAVIAHELMHLFGAVDLYPNRHFPNFNYSKIAKVYPNEIMRIQHKEISKLEVSPITSYFLGWQDSLSESDNRLLLHKVNVPEY